MLQNNQYSSNVNDVLSGLRSTGHYADVTIVSDDQVSSLPTDLSSAIGVLFLEILLQTTMLLHI